MKYILAIIGILLVGGPILYWAFSKNQDKSGDTKPPDDIYPLW